VKPGDHPDFFRLAPPPGASRESTIALDRDGHFSHDGQRVEHAALEHALRTWVSTHPDDGRPILTNGYDWVYFRVADAPLFVDALKPADDGGVTLVLFDGAEAPLDPATLSIGDDGALYAKVQRGPHALEARFSRHAQAAIAPWLVSAEPPVVEIAGVRREVRRRVSESS
jgi:hypothetical protein